MSESNKLAKFVGFIAVFLAAYSIVDFGLDLFRFEITLATAKSFGMLTLAILLYLTLNKPELFQNKA